MDITGRTLLPSAKLTFDFAGADHLDDLIENISGVVEDKGRIWTVSDEGRTFECFELGKDGLVLSNQYSLDDYFPDLPGGKEADLESVDVHGGKLWLCGSHSRVRHDEDFDGQANSAFRRRPSRHLLGSIKLSDGGEPIRESAKAMAFTGDGSIRRLLRANPVLTPFLDLPSKENGLDIEGLAVFPNSVLLGLRGPVVENHAIVASISRQQGLPTSESVVTLHKIDLGGLGIRDLARSEDAVILLAGPVTSADGPYRIHAWDPSSGGISETATLLYEWSLRDEHPEGICPFYHQGRPGFLAVYDGPAPWRRVGGKVTADWFEFRQKQPIRTTEAT
jgi:hypothetical protein